MAPDSPRIPVTVSIGVATGLPTASLDKIIERADAVLYKAKENGRNRVEADEDLVVADVATGNSSKAIARAAAAQPVMKPVPAITVPIMVR